MAAQAAALHGPWLPYRPCIARPPTDRSVGNIHVLYVAAESRRVGQNLCR
eukprot:COSAG05_NODE_5465_length_1167_cov_1.947566_1_plen_49_part_10